jgi:hypothetical protein
MRRPDHKAHAEAVEAAEREIAEGLGPLGAIERSALRLAAQITVRVNRQRDGDDAVRLGESLTRIVALLPTKPEPRDAAAQRERLARLSTDELELAERLTKKMAGEPTHVGIHYPGNVACDCGHCLPGEWGAAMVALKHELVATREELAALKNRPVAAPTLAPDADRVPGGAPSG